MAKQQRSTMNDSDVSSLVLLLFVGLVSFLMMLVDGCPRI
jgi:hypothetical protein